MSGRPLRWLGFLIGIGVVLAAGAFVLGAEMAASRTRHPIASGQAGASNWLGPVGFSVHIASISREGDVLMVSLSFRNTSTEQQRADPADFTLGDGQNGARPVFAAGCPDWGRVDLYPAEGGNSPLRDPGGTKAGSTWGPSTLCFRETGPPRRLTMSWNPDVAFGPMSNSIEIDLGTH